MRIRALIVPFALVAATAVPATRWAVVASRNDTDDDNFLNAVAAGGTSVWAVGGDDGARIERR